MRVRSNTSMADHCVRATPTVCGILWQVVGDLRQTPKGWFLVPVGQLTTQQREYTALHRAAATEVPCHRIWTSI
jgi:hypothetical protein